MEMWSSGGNCSIMTFSSEEAMESLAIQWKEGMWRSTSNSSAMMFNLEGAMLSLAVRWEEWFNCPIVGPESRGFISRALACYMCYFPILVVAVQSIFLMLIIAGHVRSLVSPPKKSHQREVAKFHSTAKFISVGLLMLAVFRVMSAEEEAPRLAHLSLDLAVHISEGAAWLIIFLALLREEAKGIAIYRNILRAWWVAFVILSTMAFSATVVSDQLLFAVLDIAPLICSLFMALCSFSGFVYSERFEKIKQLDSEKEPLLGESVPEDEEQSEAEPEAKPSAFSRAGLISAAAFLWLNPLLIIGYKRPLKITDVPLLDPVDDPKANNEAFQDEWNRQKLATPEGQIPSMKWTLFKTFWVPFCLALILIFLLVVSQFIGPLLQNLLITYMEEEHRVFSMGVILVTILLAGKVFEAIFAHQLNFRSRKLGIRMWSGVGCAVYGKALRLSLKARQARGFGEITNIMSSDLQRLLDLNYYIQQGLVIPIQVIVAVAILFKVVGVAMLAGLASLIFVLFVNTLIVRRMRTFRSKVLKAKDERMRATTECLGNMKVIKLQTWDEMFKERIEAIREEERGWVLKFMLNWGNTIFMVWNGPLVLSGVTYFTMVLLGQQLTAARVYTALTTFKIIQEPIRSVPDIIANIIQSTVSLQRIGVFLMEDEVDESAVERISADSEYAVDIEGAAFSWDKMGAEPALTDLNLKIKKGSCVAICGAVGSGKSSLLFCLMGELPRQAGTAKLSGKLAYVAQSAWIQNNSIRENILFGRAMEPDRYNEAVRVSGLISDLAQFPDGDQTEIGERGTTLSGGQKQRVQLARAVYQDADVYVLDDPFSAVDAHTGTFLFEECVKGALKGKTVILVTHQVEFLPAADEIIVMRAPGEIVQQGTYDELVQDGKDFGAFVDALQDSLSSVNRASQNSLDRVTELAVLSDSVSQPPVPEVSGSNGIQQAVTTGPQLALSSRPQGISQISQSSTPKKVDVTAQKAKGKLIQEEIRAVGRVNSKVTWAYLSRVGKGSLWALILVPQIATTTFVLVSDLWLASGTSTGRPTSLQFMWIYCSFLLGCSMCVYIRTRLVAYTGVATAQAFFTGMLTSILRAPMSFIDSTPVGRILTRSSTDQTALDIELPNQVAGVGNNVITLLGAVLITTYVTPQILFFTIPLGYLFIKLQLHYITSARELSRLTSLTEAPMYLHISESVGGATTIRAFKEYSRFADTNVLRFESYQRAYFHNMTAMEWLGFRLDSITAAVVASVAILLITLPEGTVAPGMAGMSLSYGLSLSAVLMRLVSATSLTEVKMISVERIMQYSNIPSEAPTVIPDRRPSADWPKDGRIELQNLQIRYRPDLPMVLKGVSCVIHPREKVGVVGRTGSGKSTLIQAFFRLLEPAGGRICIDGVDITTIGLNDLRSALGVIPQEPTLFEGSVRSNLDPFNKYTDLQIWESLDKARLGHVVREKPLKLQSTVSGQGDNWSVGERQLLCLARALLKKSRILVLDEATASVDITTDAVIQLAIKKYFADCTVISVAHRIPTVIESDRLLVLDKGHLMENNSPDHLLANENSMFSKLVKEYTNRTES